MNKLRYLFTILLLCAGCSSAHISKQYYQVLKVVDAHTLEVEIDGYTERLKLIGIKTPESVEARKPAECFGKEAAAKAKELLDGKRVKLEADIITGQGDRDDDGRLLRYVYLPDGRLFNKLLIEEGYAYEYTHDKPYKYQKEFEQARKSAQRNKRGLWAEGACS